MLSSTLYIWLFYIYVYFFNISWNYMFFLRFSGLSLYMDLYLHISENSIISHFLCIHKSHASYLSSSIFSVIFFLYILFSLNLAISPWILIYRDCFSFPCRDCANFTSLSFFSIHFQSLCVWISGFDWEISIILAVLNNTWYIRFISVSKFLVFCLGHS